MGPKVLVKTVRIPKRDPVRAGCWPIRGALLLIGCVEDTASSWFASEMSQKMYVLSELSVCLSLVGLWSLLWPPPPACSARLYDFVNVSVIHE